MHIHINKKYLIYGNYKAKCAIGKRGIGYKKKEGDLITVTRSVFGTTTSVIGEVTAPFFGIYSVKTLIEDFQEWFFFKISFLLLRE